MNADRAGGPPPIGHGRDPTSKVSREEKQKIEKVREVDPDEETQHRKRKFRALMGDEEAPVEIDPKRAKPSPYQTTFHISKQDDDLNDVEDKAIPSPSYSPAPDVNSSASSEEEHPGDLPQSDDFWENATLPGDEPHFSYQETERSLARENEKKKASSNKKEESPPPFFAPAPEAATASRPERKKSSAEAAPSQDKQKESRSERQILPLSHLPADIQPQVQSSVSAAAPYLSHETALLFSQMIGQIYLMIAPPGISRTEITLNNPLFANSKFFGCTITLEKYTTAPDSFNIRLSGSDAAVVAFKAAIPALMTTFQNGNFNFRIHRLEAEYKTEKPLFHRKGKGKEKHLGGDFEGDLR